MAISREHHDRIARHGYSVNDAFDIMKATKALAATTSITTDDALDKVLRSISVVEGFGSIASVLTVALRNLGSSHTVATFNSALTSKLTQDEIILKRGYSKTAIPYIKSAAKAICTTTTISNEDALSYVLDFMAVDTDENMETALVRVVKHYGGVEATKIFSHLTGIVETAVVYTDGLIGAVDAALEPSYLEGIAEAAPDPIYTKGGYTMLGVDGGKELIVPLSNLDWVKQYGHMKGPVNMNKLNKIVELVEERGTLHKQIEMLQSVGLDDVSVSIYFSKDDEAIMVESKVAVIDLVTHNLQQRLEQVETVIHAANVALNMVTGL
jgi:hypothetical protein